MIKRWLNFNENIDDITSFIKSKIDEIREIFTDFEDMNIVSYALIKGGEERGVGHTFNPKTSDYDRWLDLCIPGIRYAYKNKKSDIQVCIISHIKLPAEQNEFGSSVINSEGIKLFEDILTANSRLIDAGYDIKLDMNSNHHEYKPAKFLIYFNI
jgi:hypothetical protein